MGSILRASGSFNVKRIAIVGAGPSGLAVAKYLQAESTFSKIDVYEQQSEVGGVWNYTPDIASETRVPQTTPRAPPDELIWPPGASAPLFSNPMYDHLNTNIPKDLMRFSDLRFPEESLLFPSREDVQDYLVQYSKDVRHLIAFSMQVQKVHLTQNNGQDRWHLIAKSTITNEQTCTEYDALVVASGHYTVPFIPAVPGIEEFHRVYPSVITHSKTYRAPGPFTNKKVIVVGSAASGLDIGTQISEVCKKPLLNSVRSSSPLKLGQENKEEVPPIAKFSVTDRAARFTNGRIEKDIDAIVYCTGYMYSYPFLESLDPPIVDTGSRVMGLYKHLFNISHPTLAFTALQKKIIPFPLSEAQGAVLAGVWTNRLSLPGKNEMAEWEKSTIAEMGDSGEFHVLGYPKDGEYINELHDWAMTAEGAGKESPFWTEKEWWMREVYVEARKKFIETGGTANTLGDIGLEFKKREE